MGIVFTAKHNLAFLFSYQANKLFCQNVPRLGNCSKKFGCGRTKCTAIVDCVACYHEGNMFDLDLLRDCKKATSIALDKKEQFTYNYQTIICLLNFEFIK